MSTDENKLEAAYQSIVEESIRSQFEKNGVMSRLRGEMHVKVLQMMRGQLEMTKSEPLTGVVSRPSHSSSEQGLVTVINQLVMEFFNWLGYRHSLETFRMETGQQMVPRSEIENYLTLTPESKEIPLLAQLTMRYWIANRQPKRMLDQKVSVSGSVAVPAPLPAIENPMPQRCLKLKAELEALRTGQGLKVQKMVQDNMKLIKNDIARKTTVVKQMRPCASHVAVKTEQKSSVESSDTEFDSYYSEYSEDSDAYADIPDRHVYVEDLPPEGKYSPGHGEEGPYDAKQNEAENLFQRYQREKNSVVKPTTSKKTLKRKASKAKATKEVKSEVVPPLSGKEALELQLSKCKPQTSAANKTRKARGNLWAKASPDLEEEPVLAVVKPKCPETHIGSVNMNSDDNSDVNGEDSGYDNSDEDANDNECDDEASD